MKKVMTFLAAMAFALTFGVAFADEYAPMAKDMRSIVQDDGVTYASLNGVTFVGVDTGNACMVGEGSAAGGLAAEEISHDLRRIVQDDRFTYTAPDNGISFSAEIAGPTCSWARGLELELHNGISIPGGTMDQ